MTFYHGTSFENWEKIQREGILFGVGRYKKSTRRFPYLAVHIEDSRPYGEVILQVEYNPFLHRGKNNFCAGCWQIRVYEPIPISNVQRII